ncbi:VOC family protein [Mucilaginibacter sp. HD30]
MDQASNVKQSIIHIALLVQDYDHAIEFYINKLQFTLLEDTQLPDDKRWVLVKPPGESACSLLLAKAANQEQLLSVGNQSGGRVFLFLETDDFYRDYSQMKTKGIHCVREPKIESYGTVAVFEDLYGNLWDLIQRNNS